MKNSNYSVEIFVNGRSVREFTHIVNGEPRTFIEGRNGTQYSLKVTNHTGQRILAIASVDGLNVVSGDIGDGFKGRGYIVKPYDSIMIKGFRESDNTVGTFQFTDKDNSYAKEQGGERNVGVISCNILDEKPQPVQVTKIIENHHHHHHPYPEPKPLIPFPKPYVYWGDIVPISNSGDDTQYKQWNEGYSGSTGHPGHKGTLGTVGGAAKFSCSSDSAMSANCLSADMASEPLLRKKSACNFDMGTKWGQRQEHKITRVHFDKNQIVTSFSIYYASRNSLEAMGIVFYEPDQVDLPNGFEGYCKPPKNWVGRPNGGRDGSGMMM